MNSTDPFYETYAGKQTKAASAFHLWMALARDDVWLNRAGIPFLVEV